MTLQNGRDDSTNSKVKIKLVRPDSARNSNMIPKRPMSAMKRDFKADNI